jgi:hypothetical protein
MGVGLGLGFMESIGFMMKEGVDLDIFEKVILCLP